MTTFQDTRDTPTEATPPISGSPIVERASLLLGAGLIGIGVIVWIAGNWDGFGRHGRFALVNVLLISCLGVAVRNLRLRPAALLVAHFGIGGLLVLIGQTYQTGADPWTLFAAWAAFSLPLALAVRGESLWTAWVAVVMAGIALYLKNEGWTPSRGNVDILVALVAWSMAFAMAILMFPAGPIRTWIGRSTWAWRTGILLSVLIVAPTAGYAIFQSTPSILFGVGLLALGGMFTLIYNLRPFDVVATAIVALGIDALLITGSVRLAFEGNNLFGGIAIVAVVALLAVGMTSKVILARWSETHDDESQPEGGTRKPPPWGVVVFSGVGALFAVIPVTALVAYALFTVAGVKVMEGPFPVLIGGAIALGGTKILRSRAESIFAIVLGLVLCLSGLALVYFGSVRAVSTGGAYALVSAFLVLIALATPQPWIRSLLGAFAAVTVGLSMRYLTSGGVLSYSVGNFALAIASHVVLLSVLVAYVRWPKAFPAGRYFLAGWLAAAVVTHALGTGWAFPYQTSVWMISSIAYFAGVPTLWWPFAMLVSMLGPCWLLWRREDLHRPIVVILCVLAIAMTGFVPRLAVPMLVGAVAFVEGYRRLAALAAISGAWVLGSLYYSQHLPLTIKGIILVVFGQVILGAVMAFRRVPVRSFLQGEGPAEAGGRFDRQLILVACMALVVFCGLSAAAKEAALREGSMVMLPLLPHGQHSLLKGDYLTLALDLAPDMAKAQSPSFGAPQPVAIGRFDEKGVVTVSAIRQGRPDHVQPGQIVIALKVKNGRYVVASDTWFFTESTVNRFRRARYGILRVMPDGTAMLAGLADAERRQIY